VRGQLRDQPDSMRHLPLMPAPRFRSELRTDFRSVSSWMKNFYSRVELEYNFRQDQFLSAFGTETATPDYTLVNLGVGFDVTRSAPETTGEHVQVAAEHPATKLLTVNFIVQNLFDRPYQSHLNRLKYGPLNPATGRQGIFNMGRNFLLRLSVPIEFL